MNKLQILTLCSVLTVLAPGCRRGEFQAPEPSAARPIPQSPALPVGHYPVQSVSYDDATGVYAIFVLDVPAGHKPLYQHNEVQMARVSDEAIQAGKKSELEFEATGRAILHLTPDFQITYVHNVTEERVDPATREREVVVVGQQTSSWSPFMGAMTGAMIGNMLSTPRYYYPPPFTTGGMAGYGSMGETRTIASRAYTERFGTEPRAVRLSKTGMAPRAVDTRSLRTSGSGAGSSRLRSTPPSARPRGGFSFGLGRGRRR